MKVLHCDSLAIFLLLTLLGIVCSAVAYMTTGCILLINVLLLVLKPPFLRCVVPSLRQHLFHDDDSVSGDCDGHG